MRARLNKELVPPRIECLKRFRTVDVVYEYATIGTPIEGNTERLETLLSGGVP